MYDFTIELSSFESLSPQAKVRFLLAQLEALIAANVGYLESGAHVPSLYHAGIRYTPDVQGDEKWKDIARVIGTRAGNCKEFAAWRVAELRFRGDPLARCVVTVTPLPQYTLFHITVRRGDGTLEDPSRALGMPEPQ